MTRLRAYGRAARDAVSALVQYGPRLLYERQQLSRALKAWSELPAPITMQRHSVTSQTPPQTEYSIVIPIYGALEEVTKLLKCLSEDMPENAREICIVDDNTGREDLTSLLREFAARSSRVRLIANAENVGFARSTTIGIEACTSDHILVLNSDTEPGSGALDRLMDHFEHDDRLATICPMSNHAVFANVGDPDGGAMWDPSTIIELDRKLAETEPRAYQVPFSSGFCWGVRRSLFSELGGFSDVFQDGYGEEADFCLRAQKAGYLCKVAVNSVVYHQGSASFGVREAERGSRMQSIRLLSLHPHFLSLVRNEKMLADAREARAFH